MRRFVIVPILAAALGVPNIAAGAVEDAFLAKLVGDWSGIGSVTGSRNADLACTLTFKESGARLKYSGRCDAEDLGGRSFSGTLYYNEAESRYEAKSAGTTTIGVKKGSSVVFVTKIAGIAGKGSSTMTVSPTRMVIDFNLTQGNGDTIKSHVTFKP
ncbi:MAG TPA: hypothetical protein VG757_05725 [Devosia sp.]|nr:hypothetical protein [Devosia sp.]